MRKVDLTGRVFDRLTVLSESGRNPYGAILWLCKCVCGVEKIISGDNLKSRQTKSCGCYARESIVSLSTIHGHNRRGKQTPEYIAWFNMLGRCYKNGNSRYSSYGARGIKVCERWKNSFVDFLTDMGKRPSPLHSIDRIDNNGNYEPSNCRWVIGYVQHRNKTTNRFIEYKGERMIVADWARRFNAYPQNLLKMLKSKTFEDIYKYYTSRKRRSPRKSILRHG